MYASAEVSFMKFLAFAGGTEAGMQYVVREVVDNHHLVVRRLLWVTVDLALRRVRPLIMAKGSP